VADIEGPAQEACSPGEEKETLAFRKDNLTTRQSTLGATLPMGIVSVGLVAPANPSAQTKDLVFSVTPALGLTRYGERGGVRLRIRIFRKWTAR
jgi:hypothetical protein